MNEQLEADSESPEKQKLPSLNGGSKRRCLASSSQPRRGSRLPNRQVSWLRIIARWTPSQGHGLGGSRPRLLGYSDGFAPDLHRLPFSALLRATCRRSLLMRAGCRHHLLRKV